MVFNGKFPFEQYTVGFDNLFDSFEKAMQNTGSTYPPYNIVRLNETDHQIEIALAGYSKDDLVITEKDHVLTVKTVDKKDSTEADYVHRGIAHRHFSRQWRLADDCKVASADMINGMLLIKLIQIKPEIEQEHVIAIGEGSSVNEKQLLTEETS